MNTIRQTTIRGHQVILEARDQYNDYSVVYDYRLEVREPGQSYGRTWDLGTSKAKAQTAFERACSVVTRETMAIAA